MSDQQTDPIPTGWQCPVCRKVHAPHVDSCDCHERAGYTWPQLKEKYFPNMPEEPETPLSPVTIPAPKWDKIIVGDPPGWLTNPAITITRTFADSQTWRHWMYQS